MRVSLRGGCLPTDASEVDYLKLRGNRLRRAFILLVGLEMWRALFAN